MTHTADHVRGRASLLTPTGRGAVAVIAATGPAAIATIDSHFQAANGLRLGAQPVDCIAFGRWSDGGDNEGADDGEEVIVCRTGKADVEVHCHGGVAAAERIMGALGAAGCCIEPWQEWVRRGQSCLLAAEAHVALAAAATRRTAAILLDQCPGALRRSLQAVHDDLAPSDPPASARARDALATLLDRAALGLHLTRPWRVAIAGLPNVGKSSLLNALLGYQRAIVFDQPGTTRDVLAAETAIDGWPVRLTDSAGLRRAADALEATGVALARQHLLEADLIVWVLDASALSPSELADPAAAAHRQLAGEAPDAVNAPLLPVVNKSDLAAAPAAPDAVCTCALTGDGLPVLLSSISPRLVPSPPQPGDGVPFAPRQVELLSAARNHLTSGQPSAAREALAALLRR